MLVSLANDRLWAYSVEKVHSQPFRRSNAAKRGIKFQAWLLKAPLRATIRAKIGRSSTLRSSRLGGTAQAEFFNTIGPISAGPLSAKTVESGPWRSGCTRHLVNISRRQQGSPDCPTSLIDLVNPYPRRPAERCIRSDSARRVPAPLAKASQASDSLALDAGTTPSSLPAVWLSSVANRVISMSRATSAPVSSLVTSSHEP